VTSVIFKLSKKVDYQRDNDYIQSKMAVTNKQLYSIQTPKIDWHDWEFINEEKLRTGKIMFILFIPILFYLHQSFASLCLISL